MYKHEDYDKLIQQTIQNIKDLSKLKGGEYAGDEDRLANFRRNAAALGLPMETVWAVYAAKHWDAVMQYIKDRSTGTKRPRMESIEGRADDLIVYLILFKAMCDERNREEILSVNKYIGHGGNGGDADMVGRSVYPRNDPSWKPGVHGSF